MSDRSACCPATSGTRSSTGDLSRKANVTLRNLGVSRASSTSASATYDAIATPVLRRRHLPVPGAALAVDGEVPTVTFAAATTIASGTTTGVTRTVANGPMDMVNDPTFLVGGTPTLIANTASPSNRVRAPIITGGTGQSARYTPTFWFYCDAAAFEFVLIYPGATLDYRVVTDGKLSIASTTVTPGGGNNYMKFDYGTAKPRLIGITINDPDFLGIRVPTLYRAWRPPQGFQRRLFVVGDSIVHGSGVPPTNTAVPYLARLLGCDDAWDVGIGGTGWVTDGSGTTRFSDRVTTDLVPLLAPNDVMLFWGSRNDPYGTGPQIATLTAAVTSTLALVSSVRNVFVAGTITTLTACNAAVQAGAVAAGRPFIDVSAAINGTGKVGATVGDGNADFYIGPGDTIHPSVAGYPYLARRLDAGIRANIPA